ncbi:hypothetical protein, partial [Ruminococcus callidus]|uniref:hypothetical protein n=1 Tax=Ruminococcus callidus TaxID=40519 RepID=UPI0023F87D90
IDLAAENRDQCFFLRLQFYCHMTISFPDGFAPANSPFCEKSLPPKTVYHKPIQDFCRTENMV